MLDRSVLVRIEFTDLKKLYMNQRVPILRPDGETVMKSAAELWLASKKCRQYLEGVVFDPTRKAPPSYWNLYTGFGVAPTPGDWSLMRQHIREVICAGEREYLCLSDQLGRPNGSVSGGARRSRRRHARRRGRRQGHPSALPDPALGQHGIHISSAEHLVGNFNAHLRDAIFLFADEAFFAGDKKHEGRLKALITESFFTVEGKYRDVVMVKNMLHIIMASNFDWVIPASLKARRWFMLDVPGTHRGDHDYFRKIAAQMDNGGLLPCSTICCIGTSPHSIRVMCHSPMHCTNSRSIASTVCIVGGAPCSIAALPGILRRVSSRDLCNPLICMRRKMHMSADAGSSLLRIRMASAPPGPPASSSTECSA